MMTKSHNFLSVLRARRLVAQLSHEEELSNLLSEINTEGRGPLPAVYIGFDPTAKSLHVGHLMQLRVLRYAQDCGLQPIVLFGGATGLIGDPTGRNDMRQMNTPEEIESYIENFRQLARKYFRYDVPNAPLFLNNFDWLGQMTWLEFARRVGVHFTVARLLSAEVNKSRFENGGLTFMELGYQLLQSYDFLYLFENHNCLIQIGGNDQWSNVLGGADLIRRVKGEQAFAITTPLIVTSSGQKLGKTAGNAVWLDPTLTSPYEFFQYFRNVEDKLVPDLLLALVGLDESDVLSLCENINNAKETLAFRLTELVHSAAEAELARATARAFFAGEGVPLDAPTTVLAPSEINSIDLLDLLVKTELTASRSEARKLIQGKGLNVNGSRCEDVFKKITKEDFPSGKMTLRKGKKDYHIVKLEN